MPRGDRTGPRGWGAMAGRAAGFCSGYEVPGYANQGAGRGLGMGRGFRGGNRGSLARGLSAVSPGGRWGRAGVDPYGGPVYAAEAEPRVERRVLRQQAKALQAELDAVNKRLEELKQPDGTKSAGD